jgi:hypothetical protein
VSHLDCFAALAMTKRASLAMTKRASLAMTKRADPIYSLTTFLMIRVLSDMSLRGGTTKQTHVSRKEIASLCSQ